MLDVNTIAIAKAQAITSGKPLQIYSYGKTIVIAHINYPLPRDAIKLAEVDSEGNYRDCTAGQQQD